MRSACFPPFVSCRLIRVIRAIRGRLLVFVSFVVRLRAVCRPIRVVRAIRGYALPFTSHPFASFPPRRVNVAFCSIRPSIRVNWR